MRFLFAGGGTGGHLYPGLAIARALVRLEPRAEPFFIGVRRGVDRDILPTTEFPHLLLDLHPLYRARPWENWRTAVGLAGAWSEIGRVVKQARPRLALGTGGYGSAATLAYAATHGIPIALQEANSFPGLATRWLSRWAREIYLGYDEARRWLPAKAQARAFDTGNPIEPPPVPRPDRRAARREWGFHESLGSVLLVFGGSQGARPINDAMAEWIERGLPADLFVIWGTGRGSYDEHAHHASAQVCVRPYLSPIQSAYAACDLALSRSGAGALAELAAWGIPQVLVPLPTAAADHQSANARALADAGAAVVIAQRELTADRLRLVVGQLLSAPDELAGLATASAARGRPHAAEDISRRILTLADLKQFET